MQMIPYYMERARAVRALAATMTGSESRSTLLLLADQWEALATQVGRLRKTQNACDEAGTSAAQASQEP